MPAAVSSATRTLESGLTYFTSAEIDVVLVPVGDIPLEIFHHYATLVMQHRQVELSNVRSFYKSSQKSPFSHFPWKTGTMNFRFLPEEWAARARPMSCLHASRTLHAAIGIISCQHAPDDIATLYDDFERKVEVYPQADIVRCLAFDPSDTQVLQDVKGRPDLVLFPPGQGDHLLNHMEVVMHDFAACMLNSLEQKILTVSPKNISLTSFVDSAEFLGSGMSLAAFASEDESQRTKRRYGRVQKIMGDYALLSGSPLDAAEHYSTAADLGRVSQDWIFAAAALEGYLSAKLLHEAMSRNAFVPSEYSVFHNEEQWRTPPPDQEVINSNRSSSQQDMALSPKSSRRDVEASSANNIDSSNGMPEATDSDATKYSSLFVDFDEDIFENNDPFTKKSFWRALRGCEEAIGEVDTILEESRSAIRKRGALGLMVESDLRYARFLAGLYGVNARNQVLTLASSIQLAAELLPLPEDRLIALTEAASVLGAVGATRKRVLLLWQTVELSKYFGFPDERTLAVARNALEPYLNVHDRDDEWAVFRRPLSQDTSIPESWGIVRAGILEATLGLAIYAKRHADVWDAAAALLRDHCQHLSGHRITSLHDNLKAAASHMTMKDRSRPGKGPPPLLYFSRIVPLQNEDALHVFSKNDLTAAVSSPLTSPNTSSNPFLYDAFEARRKGHGGTNDGRPRSITWVCGETGAVEVEIFNPCPIDLKVDRLILEALYNGSPANKDQWKPKAVSISVPGKTGPVKIVLEGTPLAPGRFSLVGCRVTAFGGISWHIPWSEKPAGVRGALKGSEKVFVVQGNGENEDQTEEAPETHCFYSTQSQPSASLQFEYISGPSAERDENLQFLQGQNITKILKFENIGPIPIHYASLKVELSQDNTSSSSRIDVDLVEPDVLSAALPLAPGQLVEIPVRFASRKNSVIPASLAQDEIFPYRFIAEYASEEDDLSISQSKIIGRRAQSHVRVVVKPSITFSELGMEEVWSLDAHSKQWGQSALLLVGVVNRGPSRLSVWLEYSKLHFSSSEQKVGKESDMGPGERVVLSLHLPRLFDIDLEVDLSEDQELLHEIRSKCTTLEEREKQLSAAWLAKHIRMCFRVSDDEENNVGNFPLSRGEVYNGLSPQLLSLVRGFGISMSIDITGFKESVADAKAFTINDSDCQPAISDNGLSALFTMCGHQLKATVVTKSNLDQEIDLCYSLHAHPISFTPVLVSGHLVEAFIPTEIGTSAILTEVEALAQGIFWSGLVEEVQCNVPQRGSTKHSAILSFSKPGWYMVTLSHVCLRGNGGIIDNNHSNKAIVSMKPVFAFVSEGGE